MSTPDHLKSKVKTAHRRPAIHNLVPALLSPAAVTLLVMLLVVAAVIAGEGGDPLALARLGTRFAEGDPLGTEGYDGQFIYYIALNPHPQAVAPFLDVPAYRYQRILLPLLASLLSAGSERALPWVLALLGILSQAAGTWAVGRLLAGWGMSRWYALVYGLWAGFTLSLRLDLPEPLAFGLVAGAILAMQRSRPFLGWTLYSLALFAKEVTVLFIAAHIISELAQSRWRPALGLCLATLLPYGLFQGWLWMVFGQPGIGSGGAMATPFEWIPYMGLVKIGGYSLVYFLAMLIVFGPLVVWPSLWGIWISFKTLLAGDRNVIVLALLLNALAIAFLPFSTFRETGGLIRFACGLVLSVILFAGRYRYRRVLNYSTLWLVLNMFLIKS